MKSRRSIFNGPSSRFDIRHSTFDIRWTFDFRPSTFELFIPLALVGFSFLMALRSSGFFELDELAHYMKARECWTDWRELLDIWGRPMCTGLFALAAPWGLKAARLLAMVVMSIVALGTVQLSTGFVKMLPSPVRHHRVLLWILLFAQPLFLLHSFAVMSEMLLACLWVWAAVALLRDRLLLAGLLVGLGGLARPEGWIAIACWPVVLGLVGRRQKAEGSRQKAVGGKQKAESESQKADSHLLLSFHPLLVFRHPVLSAFRLLLSAFRVPPSVPSLCSVVAAVTPTLAWWLAGWRVFGGALWFVQRWPWAARSPYGITAGRFLIAVALVTMLWMLPFAFEGIRFLWLHHAGSFEYERAFWIIAAPLLGFLMLHGVLGLFGLFGSLSLPRYFVAVSPFLALASWIGVHVWKQQVPHTRFKHWFWVVIVALTLTPALTLLFAGQLPIPRNAQFRRLDEAIAWLQQHQRMAGLMLDPDPEHVIAAHPYVYYRLGVPLNCYGHRLLFAAGSLRAAPPGSLAIVENVIWQFDGFAKSEELTAWGYRKIWTSDNPKATGRSAWVNLLPGGHLLSLVGDAAEVQIWVKQW
ncbi:MAG TPA: hypothetical protein VGQ81_00295 [Acidobacteriota bacterium]|nr:hypothetical protein [Acidobacteriota bacterium]